MKQSIVGLITLAIALGFAEFIAAQGITSDAGASLVPEESVVLLSNGQILNGRVTRAGDFFYVVLPHGEIRLRPSEVELICTTIDEGYQKKRAALPPGEIDGHLALADWCVRHHLHDYAVEQLAAARRLDPSQLKIGLIERRLQLDRERSVTEPTTSAAVQHGPTNDDLDKLVRSLPVGVLDQFSNHVQPLLLNNCTASGCHAANSTTGYALMRIPLGRNASRRLTQRNLYETLQHVNRAKPTESPLITNSIRPHGGSKTAVFVGRDLAQFQHLLAFVQRLSETPRHPPTAGNSPVAADKPVATNNLLLQSPPPATAPGAVELPVANKPQLIGDPATQPAVDPFDPDVFNRRHHPDRTAKPAPSP